MFNLKTLNHITAPKNRSSSMENEIIIEDFKNETLSPFLWINWLTFGAVGFLSIFFFLGTCSKLAIIRYTFKYAPKRPINQNILIDQVIAFTYM